MTDVVVIGGGHNGLTTAFYLAKSGFKVVVVERLDRVGGGAATEEIAPGYRCPTLAHAIGPLRPGVARDMHLERHGATFLRPDPRLVAVAPNGRALAFSTDVARTAAAIRAFSEKDAERYPEFCATLTKVGALLGGIVDRTPPSLNPSAPHEFWDLLKTGRRFRALGRADSFRLLRWLPMAVADLVAEWFESDLLQAAIAARGVFGTAMGPWSAGSGAVMLMQAAMDDAPGGSSVTVQGGPGALASAMASAAREAGVEIRTAAGAARIVTKDGVVTGVALESGAEIPARTVVSSVDPRRTLLSLLDPFDLEPDFRRKIRNYRSRGTVAKLNFALSALPEFGGVAGAAFAGRIHIGPTIDYIEHAFDASKYGELPQDPYLDVAVPSVGDPSLAPPSKHVVSVVAQFVPYTLRGGAEWASRREELAAIVRRTLGRYSPGFESLIEHQQVFSPADLERDFAYTGGNIFHGEPSLDQLFTMRPLLGWSQYRTPVGGLYMCGAGTHGGLGISGASGRSAAREVVRDLKRTRAAAR